MKEYSNYSYRELYEIANHLDPFEYREKIEEVKLEISKRREDGLIPNQLIPSIQLEKGDLFILLKSFGLFLLKLFYLVLIGYFFKQIFADLTFQFTSDYLLSFIAAALIFGFVGEFYRNRRSRFRMVISILFLASLLTYGFLNGFSELTTLLLP